MNYKEKIKENFSFYLYGMTMESRQNDVCIIAFIESRNRHYVRLNIIPVNHSLIFNNLCVNLSKDIQKRMILFNKESIHKEHITHPDLIKLHDALYKL